MFLGNIVFLRMFLSWSVRFVAVVDHIIIIVHPMQSTFYDYLLIVHL